MRPRRSVLFMPGANQRAMAKAKELPCDAIIFDLEDAVAPDDKAMARGQVVEVLRAGGYGPRELLVRTNPLASPWFEADLDALCASWLPLAGYVFPKVDSAEQLERLLHALAQRGQGAAPVWAMIESPLAVLNADKIAAVSPRLSTLVMGTSDLLKELRGRVRPDRRALMASLEHCVLVARAHQKCILDGVHLEFKDLDELRVHCEQARDLGFDGKTLIHPTQIGIANEIFSPSPQELVTARRVLDAWQSATDAGKGLAVLDGKLIEHLHVQEAQRLLDYAKQIQALGS